ncbi:hypothetical protein IJ541_00345 [bacterium]|nr:hypothetical protein [bacterium]
MNLLSLNKDISALLVNWADSKPVPQLIDSVTYDLYEDNNPFRKQFSKSEINNKELRLAVNTAASLGAETFSLFANPYYLSHKVTQIPVYYQSAVDLYNKK